MGRILQIHSRDNVAVALSEIAKGEQLTAGELKIAAARGNDLFRPACELLPVVGEIVATLRQDGFLLSGMSGSGSCCYALSLDPHKLKAEGKAVE